MKIKPAGFYVLIRMDTIEDLSEGGIYMGDKQTRKEQEACEFGVIVAFGPAAYKGFPGCEGPHDWGVEVGDKIEYRRYEGKMSSLESQDNFRYIPDSHIIGVISDE